VTVNGAAEPLMHWSTATTSVTIVDPPGAKARLRTSTTGPPGTLSAGELISVYGVGTVRFTDPSDCDGDVLVIVTDNPALTSPAHAFGAAPIVEPSTSTVYTLFSLTPFPATVVVVVVVDVVLVVVGVDVVVVVVVVDVGMVVVVDVSGGEVVDDAVVVVGGSVVGGTVVVDAVVVVVVGFGAGLIVPAPSAAADATNVPVTVANTDTAMTNRRVPPLRDDAIVDPFAPPSAR
jgi:hypothetical protein